MRSPLLVGLVVLLLAACGADPEPDAADPVDFPSVVAAEAALADDGTWRFSVTLSSPYDSPERYADAWRVTDLEGVELGVRILAHDHAQEQPFTRSLGGVVIDTATETVVIEGRDLLNGWGGPTLAVDLDRS